VLGRLVDFAARDIVSLAVGPDLSEVSFEGFKGFVLVCLQILLQGGQVHGLVLDHLKVVGEPELLPADGLLEGDGLRVPLDLGHHKVELVHHLEIELGFLHFQILPHACGVFHPRNIRRGSAPVFAIPRTAPCQRYLRAPKVGHVARGSL